MAKLYGSLQNRLQEDKMFVPEIKIGTGMTEYFYSDRHAYEVVEVMSQTHVRVRELKHEHIGTGSMDNNWKLSSDPDAPVRELQKRGKYWYEVVTLSSDLLDLLPPEDYDGKYTMEQLDTLLFMGNNNVTREDLQKRGTVKRYHRVRVSFGFADYYYDYEF